MKVIVISTSPSAGNIVKNSLQQAKIPDLECVALENADAVAEHLNDDAFVLVDWEAVDPVIPTRFVQKTREAAGERPIPILLLAGKQAASTTFPGMKAGASGVLQKPFTAEELVKALGNAKKQNKGSKSASINVEFINPFIEATKSVFQTMANVAAERKKLYLKDDHKMLGDISGVMGLSGSATGSVVISMPNLLAVQIVSAMLGETPGTEVTPEICDGVGEIINMIAGQAKASLTKTKYHFQISIPTVVQGHGHEITHKQGTPNIVVLFEATGQTFAIQVCLSPKGA